MEYIQLNEVSKRVADESYILIMHKYDVPIIRYYYCPEDGARWSWPNGKSHDPHFFIRESQFSMNGFLDFLGWDEDFMKSFNDGSVHHFFISSPDTVKSKFTKVKCPAMIHFYAIDADGKMVYPPVIKPLSEMSDDCMSSKMVGDVLVDTPTLYFSDDVSAVDEDFVVFHQSTEECINLSTCLVVGDKELDNIVGTKVSPFNVSFCKKFSSKILSQYYAHPAKYDILSAHVVRKVMDSITCDEIVAARDEYMETISNIKARHHTNYKEIKAVVDQINNLTAELLVNVMNTVVKHDIMINVPSDYALTKRMTTADWMDDRKREAFYNDHAMFIVIDGIFTALRNINRHI